ncbi:hypothetical protein F2Q65_00920 [Thiohalocapsa marina]|uniref:Guanylate cyclase domain-containing protein n=1 Tax=Thiohalocapsa marina TaxID=424902 RepID=A0A5M8FVI5_9GAMM|nr:adenylate/guanylate cyclase domain-containing protein [Thiohalocapsa marina]KAA6187834.1 hypothetical protein F2Q65_00920 [Thiohalocapsa marina]
MARPSLSSRLRSGRRPSFRLAILALFLAPMLITVLIIVARMSERAEQVVYQLSSRFVAEISQKVVARTDGIVHLTKAQLLSNAAVADATHPIADQALLSKLFWRQVAFTPELTSMYIGDRDGNFVQARNQPELSTRILDRTSTPASERIIVRRPDFQPIAHLTGDAQFDPRQRPWYRNATAEPRVQWTDVYRFHSGGHLGITAVYPLLDQHHRIRAVLGADATLDGISELLSRQDIGPNSAVLILDDQDRLIAYPRRLDLTTVSADPGTNRTADVRADFGAETGTLLRIDDIARPWIRNALLASTQSATGSGADSDAGTGTAAGVGPIHRSVTGGRSYLTHIAALGGDTGLPWRLAIVLDEADLLSESERTLREAIVVSAIIVSMVLFIIYPLAANFANSVQQLARNTELLRRFRPTEVVPVKSVFREIRDMDHALAKMGDTMDFLGSQIPAEAIRQLASGATRPRLRAEYKDLTVMTSAMAGLDGMIERLQPEQVIEFLATQVEHGNSIIRREDGTLETFRGDRIHAFWDLPAAPDQAARHACRAALAFTRACDRDAARHGGQVVRHTGLHCGRGLVGNLNVAGRMRYTAMGRLVAVAARLRDANARYGTRIIISQALHDEIADRFLCRPLDILRLPGEDRGDLIYELRSDAPASADTDELRFIALCAEGLQRYRRRAWEDAIASFCRALTLVPDDPACNLLIARCEQLQLADPDDLPDDWDGTPVSANP